MNFETTSLDASIQEKRAPEKGENPLGKSLTKNLNNGSMLFNKQPLLYACFLTNTLWLRLLDERGDTLLDVYSGVFPRCYCHK